MKIVITDHNDKWKVVVTCDGKTIFNEVLGGLDVVWSEISALSEVRAWED